MYIRIYCRVESQTRCVTILVGLSKYISEKNLLRVVKKTKSPSNYLKLSFRITVKVEIDENVLTDLLGLLQDIVTNDGQKKLILSTKFITMSFLDIS